MTAALSRATRVRRAPALGIDAPARAVEARQPALAADRPLQARRRDRRFQSAGGAAGRSGASATGRLGVSASSPRSGSSSGSAPPPSRRSRTARRAARKPCCRKSRSSDVERSATARESAARDAVVSAATTRAPFVGSSSNACTAWMRCWRTSSARDRSVQRLSSSLRLRADSAHARACGLHRSAAWASYSACQLCEHLREEGSTACRGSRSASRCLSSTATMRASGTGAGTLVAGACARAAATRPAVAFPPVRRFRRAPPNRLSAALASSAEPPASLAACVRVEQFELIARRPDAATCASAATLDLLHGVPVLASKSRCSSSLAPHPAKSSRRRSRS